MWGLLTALALGSPLLQLFHRHATNEDPVEVMCAHAQVVVVAEVVSVEGRLTEEEPPRLLRESSWTPEIHSIIELDVVSAAGPRAATLPDPLIYWVWGGVAGSRGMTISHSPFLPKPGDRVAIALRFPFEDDPDEAWLVHSSRDLRGSRILRSRRSLPRWVRKSCDDGALIDM